MNILLVGPNINDHYKLGGISTFVRFLLENLDFDIDYFARSSSKRSFFKFLQKTYTFRKVLQNKEYDLIHINTSLNSSSILRDFILLKINGNRKTIVHIHGGEYINKQAPLLLSGLIKYIINDRSVVVLSDLEMKLISKFYSPRHIFVLKNSVSTKFSDEINAKVPLINFSKPISIIYLGRIDKNKGLDYIVNPLLKLKEDGVDFIFNLYGDGEYKDQIIDKMNRTLGSSQFRYCGIVIGEQKMKAFVNSDIFILPSLYEGLPIALLEAMSVGRIVLTTNVGSIPTVVSNGKNGYLVEPGNSIQIFEKLCQIIHHPYPQQISISAMSTIKEGHSIAYFRETLRNIYIQSIS